jgi:hypothetical protein
MIANDLNSGLQKLKNATTFKAAPEAVGADGPGELAAISVVAK